MHVLDALTNRKHIADLAIELDGRAMDNTEHAALGFRPALGLVEPDTVDGRDGVVVNRAERHDQRGQKDALAAFA